MIAIEAALQTLEVYPRWLVTLGTILVAAAAVWVLVKLLKWTLYLAAIVTFGGIVLAMLVWWLA